MKYYQIKDRRQARIHDITCKPYTFDCYLLAWPPSVNDLQVLSSRLHIERSPY